MSIRFGCTFLGLCREKVPKEAAARNPFAKGFLTYLPKEGWGIRAFDARKRNPLSVCLNPPVFGRSRTKTGAFVRLTVPAFQGARNIVSPKRWGHLIHHRRWWMRCPPSISHRITSVGDRQTHISDTPPQQLDRGKAETSRIPLFLCASAQKQGDSIISHWVCAFSHQKRKCPILFGRIRKEPFPQKGFLAAASFGIFSRQKPRKVHP